MRWSGLLLLFLFWVGYLRLWRTSLSCRKSKKEMKALITKEANKLVCASQVPFLVSVSAFETGGFKSPVCCNNKNLFGMKHPKDRPTLDIGSDNQYARYISFPDSVVDFYLWYDYTKMPRCHSLSGFVREMKNRSYFEADYNKYLAGVMVWYEKLYN